MLFSLLRLTTWRNNNYIHQHLERYKLLDNLHTPQKMSWKSLRWRYIEQ